jgi:hypothetical protein
MPWVTINGNHVLIGEDGGDGSAVGTGFNTGDKTTDKTLRQVFDKSVQGNRSLERQSLSERNKFPKETVPVSKIVASQPQSQLNIQKVAAISEKFNSNSNLPFAVEQGGQYYLFDGHHRVAAQISSGATEVSIRVQHIK